MTVKNWPWRDLEKIVFRRLLVIPYLLVMES